MALLGPPQSKSAVMGCMCGLMRPQDTCVSLGGGGTDVCYSCSHYPEEVTLAGEPNYVCHVHVTAQTQGALTSAIDLPLWGPQLSSHVKTSKAIYSYLAR